MHHCFVGMYHLLLKGGYLSTVGTFTNELEGFNKLITNVFLTLHGPNRHCQRRELSKFLLHYQQFASHAY
jgi:hypothetical protein